VGPLHFYVALLRQVLYYLSALIRIHISFFIDTGSGRFGPSVGLIFAADGRVIG
jgi:hypothetical protein